MIIVTVRVDSCFFTSIFFKTEILSRIKWSFQANEISLKCCTVKTQRNVRLDAGHSIFLNFIYPTRTRTHEHLFFPLSVEDMELRANTYCWRRGQQARGGQEVKGNIIMINRSVATALLALSLGYLFTFSCPKTLYNTTERDRNNKSVCMCVYTLVSNLLGQRFADV